MNEVELMLRCLELVPRKEHKSAKELVEEADIIFQHCLDVRHLKHKDTNKPD